MEGDWFLKITHRLSKTRCKGTRMGPKRDLGGVGYGGWGLAGNRRGYPTFTFINGCSISTTTDKHLLVEGVATTG